MTTFAPPYSDTRRGQITSSSQEVLPIRDDKHNTFDNSSPSTTSTTSRPITWLRLEKDLKSNGEFDTEICEMSTEGSGSSHQPIHPLIASEHIEPTYRTYKRRWFGLLQLILLNIVVSWDVGCSFNPINLNRVVDYDAICFRYCRCWIMLSARF
jgi:hypothetical protein